MLLAIEIGAAIVLLLGIILVAERDDGTAGKLAQVVLVLIAIGALLAGGYWLALKLGIVGPVGVTNDY